MSSLDLTRDWLKQVLRPYPSRDRILSEVMGVLSAQRSLLVKTDAFTFDSGHTTLLVILHGTLPITYRGATYQIPINVWLPHEYPRAPPMAFVVPTKDMGVRKSREVDPGGRVREEVVSHWWAGWPPEQRDLNALLRRLAELFSTAPPVYAKPPEARTSTSSNAPASPSHGAAGSSRQSTGGGPPPPPARPYANGEALPQYRPPPSGAVQGASYSPARQTSLPMPTHTASPPPMPQSPVRTGPPHPSGPPGSPPVPPRPAQHPPGSERPYVHHQSPAQFGSPISSSGSAPWHASAPGVVGAPPPVPPAPQGHPGTFAGQRSPPPVPPHPPAHAPAGPYPPQMWATSPPQTVPGTQQPTGAPGHAQHGPAPVPPAQAPAQPPAPQPKQRAPDLLSSSSPEQTTGPLPGGEGIDGSAPPVPPSKPPPPSLLHLHAILLPHLAASLPPLVHSLEAQKAHLLERREDLATGEPAIRDEMARLEAVKKVCDAVGTKMQTVVDAGERRVAELQNRGDVSVDEVVCGISIVHNQLIDLVAEDNALSDTMYHLTRALDAERIDLDRYLKAVRSLAREQYMKRALIERINDGMGKASWSA